MSAAEFADFVAYFIPDYATEIAANYRLSQDEATEQARREIETSLPEAQKTPGHSLTTITLVDNGMTRIVGSLWYRADFIDKSAFIYDFYLRPAFRGKGLGSQAMQSLESNLRAAGIRQIKLRVATENEHARKVYEANGYQITGYNMNKLL
ncbi:GNAT family N-acetyltransferase [Kosakonia oryzae]|uniref:GNAT family N-acetyltransferase n=2 Tax=Enterobacteriaceae TaxID=543 RepID=UPI0005EDAB79|nr:GNAT family N-acetyltransferase [Kosakonia oryzae]QHM97199.1 GNAT family N-acetyltransferase [Kosakonia sacchari]